MTLPVAILAGGLATRLRPITERIPKALVDVAGKPFISRQLHYLQREGIRDVVLCIGHLGEQVQAVVGDGADYGLNVRYSWDGTALLGTGGALRKALPLLGSPFFVFYGDSYLPISFKAVEAEYLRQGKPALMTVLHNQNRWDRSNVVWDGQRISLYNKKLQRPDMTHIDYGLAILSASIIEHQSMGEAFDLAEVYNELSITGQLAGHEMHERFYEIGSHQGLAETIEYFLQRNTA